mmetsp:Transcript_55591/g.132967  ORF Transcript_55591/g.132967 Transcript_55591/m.132967 type:complete len:357 (-) Transcript_55591:1221-2291(-)
MSPDGCPKCVLVCNASADLSVTVEDDSKDDVDDDQTDNNDHAPDPNRRRPPILLRDHVPVCLERHNLFQRLRESPLDRREVPQLRAEKDVPGDDEGREDEEKHDEQVQNVLESHLKGVRQQGQARLALRSDKELEEQEDVEQRDEDNQVAISLGGPVYHGVQLREPTDVEVLKLHRTHVGPYFEIVIQESSCTKHLPSLHRHENHDHEAYCHDTPLDIRRKIREVYGGFAVGEGDDDASNKDKKCAEEKKDPKSAEDDGQERIVHVKRPQTHLCEHLSSAAEKEVHDDVCRDPRLPVDDNGLGAEDQTPHCEQLICLRLPRAQLCDHIGCSSAHRNDFHGRLLVSHWHREPIHNHR